MIPIRIQKMVRILQILKTQICEDMPHLFWKILLQPKKGRIRNVHLGYTEVESTKFLCFSPVRLVILTRPSRDEGLEFRLTGGHQRGFAIFVEYVNKVSHEQE
jgi:hypothetical protein